MRFRSVLAASALSLCTITAGAQSSGTVKFQPTNAGTTVALGYYVGPFWGTLTSDPTQPTIDLFCIDVLNFVNFGQTWTANFTNLGSSDLSLTRHGTSKAAEYQQAAYLASMFTAPGVTTTQYGGIQSAIWNLLNPGYPYGGTTVSNNKHEAYWLSLANTWYTGGGASSFDFSKWTIVTDVNAAGWVRGHGTQEFLTTSLNTAPPPPELTPVVTPEPETWMLMGTGLMVIVGFAIKRGRIV
jgi:hypothetical protein